MNFLLHFELARTEIAATRAPIIGVGAMWPDLARMAGHVVRKAPSAPASTSSVSAAPTSTAEPATDLDAFDAGVAHHFTADAWFHRSRVFREGERALSKNFLGTQTPKLVLFAHAAWEMCLDGALLRARGAPFREAVADAARASKPALERAATSLVDAGDEARRHVASRLDRMHAALATGLLYDDYASADGVARRLAGIRLGLGFARPSDEVLGLWTRALEQAMKASDEELPKLFEERRAHVLQAEGSCPSSI